MTGFSPLSHTTLNTDTPLLKPAKAVAGMTTLDQPALEVMTDFCEVRPITIAPTESLDAAHAKMIHRNVRLLFVCQEDEVVSGIITSTDLLGEKPYKHIKEHGGTRDDIQVKDIMTPITRLQGLNFEDVERSRVGHIVETLKASGRRHLLVLENVGGKEAVSIRGMFATSQVALQLGIELEPTLRARNFAELGAAILKT
jgi:CBS domain-containing protein